MDMQNVSNLQILEGVVRTIHDKDNRLIWGRLAYDTKYAGDIYQQTYSGIQLLKGSGLATPITDSSYWGSFTNLSKTDLDDGWATFTSTASASHNMFITRMGAFEWGVSTTYTVILEIKNAPNIGSITLSQPQNASDPFETVSTSPVQYSFNGQDDVFVFSGTTKSSTTTNGLRAFLGSSFASSVTLRLTIVAGDHTSDYQNYIGENYQPYTGGVPAPNPDYPQAVQTVTGEQTVTVSDGVSSQSYSIGFGSIELCKIGDYQDYIYKSGDDWYVHKACGKLVLTGEETWSYLGGTPPFYYRTTPVAGQQTTNGSLVVSNYFLPVSSWGERKVGVWFDTNLIIKTTDSLAGTGDLDSFKLWLSTNEPIFYYVLKTATNTKITDTALVEQLEAVHEWLTRYGYNATVAGNLPIIINKANL